MASDFFILLRAGLWQRAESRLSDAPDWEGIYALANQQTVTGIVADGIVVMGMEQSVPQHIRDKFIADTTYITSTNLKTTAVQTRLCRMLEEAGLTYVILKGQEAARNYPNPLLRVSGDIDILLPLDHYEKAKELLLPIGSNPIDKILAGEYSIYVDGIQVELHNNIYAGINPQCVRGFMTLFRDIFSGRKRTDDDAPFVPSDKFNAIYLLVHTIRHLGSFGISLRQILDWVMHLHRRHCQIDPQWLSDTIDMLHLNNLYDLFATFAHEYLGAPSDDTPGVPATHPATKELWSIIQRSGNFGCTSDYKTRHFRNDIHKRLYRTRFLLQQARQIGKFDREFARYLQKREVKAFFSSIFRSIR